VAWVGLVGLGGLWVAGGRPGAHERFSVAGRFADAWYDRVAGWLVVRGMPLIRRTDLHLLGDHNVGNALAAALSLPPETDRGSFAAGLQAFRALAHRLATLQKELLGEQTLTLAGVAQGGIGRLSRS